MGSFGSRPSAQTDQAVSEEFRFDWYAPPEADTTIVGDGVRWYARIHGKASCLPHKNGKDVVIFYARELSLAYVQDPREVEGWAVEKLRKAYEHLEGDHVRIVQYSGSLEDGSVVVKKLWPGSLKSLTLPIMTLPVSTSSTPSWEDKIMLSLYYRWALQSLSALSFLHAQKVYLWSFSTEQVWIRPDFSLALTAFINAVIEGKPDEDYGESGGWVEAEWVHYPDERMGHECPGSVKEDLFYWATFVWGLLNNENTSEPHWKHYETWHPTCLDLEDEYSNSSSVEAEKIPFQKLQDERLGPVLTKAWKSEYATAEEAAKDVRSFAKRMGITVYGDEIDIGKPWNDIFEVVETSDEQRELRFKG